MKTESQQQNHKLDPYQQEADRRVNKAYYILSRVCKGGVLDTLLPPNEIDDILDSINNRR